MRIRQKVVRRAVEDNVETIQGLVPASLRPGRRWFRTWFRRSTLLLIPLSLIGSSQIVSSFSTKPELTRASIEKTRTPRRQRRIYPVFPVSERFEMPVPIDTAAFPLDIHHVVLDAGHGGADPGSTAGGLILEKEITLDIERRLGALLQRASFEVTAIRDQDKTVPLSERAARANQSGGDIFVSIHVNSVRNPKSRGVETYYLGPTDDPTLTKLAAAENAVSGYSLSDLRRLLESVYADARQGESKKLASAIQEKMHGHLHPANPELENWGVRRAPFLVLTATEMPAILAEVSCLSNPDEVRLLLTPEYRQQIAEALYLGIRSYADGRNTLKEKG